jgi:DNA-binding MarR family transcriptional regulator
VGEINISVKKGRAAGKGRSSANEASSSSSTTPPRRIVDRGILPDLLGYSLRRSQEAVFSAFVSMVTAKLGAAELTPGQFGVLAIIAANPGLKQIELGGALGVDRSTVVAAVDKLEKRGLVERRAVPKDRRAHALTLTPEGQRVYRKALALVERHEARIAENLSAAERTTLFALLSKVQAAAETA